MSSIIPVVDFKPLNIDIEDDNIDDSLRTKVASQVVEAFSTVGFVYLINHGVSPDLLAAATEVTETFFKLPSDVKTKYSRQGDNNHGWVSLETESLNPERPGDLKEAYNVTPAAPGKKWPDDEVPTMCKLSEQVMIQCEKLSSRILQVMAQGLKLEDQKYFSHRHNILDQGNMTTLRYLYYPPLSHSLKAGQIRCGEHSDYGSITLLFQDGIGGLQVMSRDNEWVDAQPMPGAVLVNIGDLMQRWTADKLVSTKHRVIIPKEEVDKKLTRRSMAYFLHPDDDVMITCIDGSDKYEPIPSLDYVKMRFSVTY